MEAIEHLRGLEERLLLRAVRQDPTLVSASLSEDFREFGASGRVYTRAEIVEALRTEELTQMTLREFAAVPVAEGVYLVTYRSRQQKVNGEVREALRSSLWRLEDDQWRMVFHQGTVVAG